MTTLDLLLCTRNRPERAATVVRDVVAQDCPSLARIVVIDQSDGNALEGQLPADSRLVYRHVPPQGLPAARNTALNDAHSDVVLFVDDDVRLLPGCLQAHVSAYSDPKVGAVVGRLVERHAVGNVRHTANYVGWHGRVITQLAGLHPTRVSVTKGANMSFRRVALLDAGGFDARFGGTALLEDAEASDRVRAGGWTVQFVPAAEVVHLSDPVGGVRQDSEDRTLYWRFRNTGLFLRSRRGWLGTVAPACTFSLIAARHAVRRRSPAAARRLLAGFAQGLRDAATPRQGYTQKVTTE